MSLTIHDQIKEMRMEKKLSIQELSNLSGVSASHISRIERSDRKPSPATLEKLAGSLEVSYVLLLEIANMLPVLKTTHAFEMEQILSLPSLLYRGEELKTEERLRVRNLLEAIKKENEKSH